MTFMSIISVFFGLLTAFALQFYVLLFNKDNCATPQDAMFKTMTMMAGEFDFGTSSSKTSLQSAGEISGTLDVPKPLYLA